MAGKKIWFGNVSYAQWTPAPAPGMTKTVEGFSEEIAFDNGGLWVARSAAGHASYEMEFPTQDSSEIDSIEAYQRFAAGEYGSDYLRFIDPMRADQNLFSPEWAAPSLAEQGHKPIYDTIPTFTTTGANSFTKPPRKAVYNVTSAINAVPVGQNSVFTLLVPPTHTLWLGGSGTVTGTAVLRVQPILLNGTLASVVDIALTADGTNPGFTSGFSGSTYRAVKVYVTRTSTAASTITLTSLWAQVALTGTSPTMARHIPGGGHTGLQFRGAARVENYYMASRHLVGMSASLVEVEKWQ